uniref:DUF938 domain-containing protein n=1 Tax=Coccolithus braarudii TaxID=221442 RepID=A0A7S0L320_9EUKA
MATFVSYTTSTTQGMAAAAAVAIGIGVGVGVYLRRHEATDFAFQEQVHHPSALRNRIPILKELLARLPEDISGAALEIGSGSGAHLEVYAPAFPSLTFQPTEYVPDEPALPEQQWSKYGKIGHRQGLDELANIDSHCASVFKNVVPAVGLDLLSPWEEWPQIVREARGTYRLVICSNTLHITPWEASLGFFRGAARALSPRGHLFVYGPFKVDGGYVGADGGVGNAKFDQRLRETNALWGFRDVGELSSVASTEGLELRDKVDMPANNMLLHFVKM